MNGKLSKKVRKQINRKVRTDMEDLARTLSEARIWWRFVYAIRIVFNWHPKVKFTSRKPV